MKTLLLTTVNLVPALISIFISLMLIFINIMIKKNKSKNKSNKINQFTIDLVSSVGGISNVKLVDVENRRLTIQLNDIKQLDQVALKKIVKGAFVTRNVVKVIMDDEASIVAEQLREIKK